MFGEAGGVSELKSVAAKCYSLFVKVNKRISSQL